MSDIQHGATGDRARGQRRVADALKRGFDVLGALAGLVLLAPLLLGIALVIARRMGWPVLFAQSRPGRDGQLFTMYKFRTMRDVVDADGRVLADAERLTPLGKMLRTTSLDELPELLNVLRGDMSLVGPRPLLVEYLPLYSPKQARRHDVRPGITGWAQVNGRNAITWEEKFSRDVWYVDHRSLALDLRILLVTLGRVITGDGVSAAGEATTRRFTGAPTAATPRELTVPAARPQPAEASRRAVRRA